MTSFEHPQAQVVKSRARRLVILAICSMSLLMIGMDSTIVNVALPAIHRALRAPLSGLQWTVDAYTLVLASLLMVSGSTADRLGRRRVFQFGLAVFSVGSLACGLAPSLTALIAARVLQAIGGSMLNPVAMSIIRNVFVDPRERARAIGLWGAVFGISTALGPVVGGALIDAVSWRAVFMVNVPIGAIGLVLTALYVPESRAPRPRRLDPMGQLLVIVALGTLTYALIGAPSAGWASWRTLALGALAILALGALVAWELRRSEPLLEMRFFKSAPFAAASAIAVALFVALGGFLFLNTLYLQEVRGLSPLHAGLYTLPMAGLMVLAAPLAGVMVAARGTRAPIVSGGLALIAGGLIMTRLDAHTPLGVLFSAYVLFGFGAGLLGPPITNTAITGMPPSQAGVAGAVASSSRQIGQTIGVALLGALAGGGADRVSRAFPQATHPSWWIVAALGACIACLGLLSTTAWARASARRTAQRLAEPSEAAPAARPAAPSPLSPLPAARAPSPQPPAARR
ncbi:MAG TPA: MFS transporter [Solirubrobacteraceae bacterium]|nr:MFS transporter [Solirubrobacteraceae bacterium]